MNRNIIHFDDELPESVLLEEETETSPEAFYSFTNSWNDIKESISLESDSGSALITNALYLHHQELQDTNRELRCISALLLILVVFEMLRLVRSWTKGVGIK